MGRHSCCIKQKLRKGLWSPEEDEKLYNYITRFGVGCWSTVPKLAGLQRCGKSCRLRWINYLRPNLKRGMFSQQEEDLIIRLHEVLGNRWAQIAAQLPGRTDNEIKNFWNSCLKKKLLKQGIDPNTHQPVIENIELEELTKDHHQHQQQQQLQQQQSTKCSNNNNHGISHSSSTTTSSSSAGYNNGHSQHRQYMNNNSNNNNNNIKHVVYDPFFLLDFQTNILADDPSRYNSSGCNFLNLNQYCQQSTTIRPPPLHPQPTAATSGFETFPNNNNGFMMINNNSSLPNLTNLDQESVMNNNNRMMGNGGGVSWDLENKLVESVNYLQFINGIQIEEDVKKQPLLLPPRPPPCPWDESHRGIVIDESSNQNSGDLMISNYPLTSLSAEDFCGANLDPVFTHI